MKLKLIAQRHNGNPAFDVTDVLSDFRLVEQANGIINFFFKSKDKYLSIGNYSGMVDYHNFGQFFHMTPYIDGKDWDDFPDINGYYDHEQYYCIDLAISGIAGSYRCDIMPLKHEYHITLIPFDMCVVDKSQDNKIELGRG